MRWSVSATEIIFLNRPLSVFWSLGKVVPGVRGWGARQPAIDFLINRLNEGTKKLHILGLNKVNIMGNF